MTRAEDKTAIAARIDDMADDEVALLRLAAERIVAAQATYGRLDLATNGHDTEHEALLEAIDLPLWLCIGLLKRQRAAGAVRRALGRRA